MDGLRARRHLHPVHRQPARVGARPAPALDHAGLPVLGAVRPAHPRRHARDDERGLHPHRPGQGPAGAHGRRQARAARRAHPDPHDLRPGPRPAARRRDPHRAASSRSTGSASTPSTASRTTTCRRCSASRCSPPSSSSSPTWSSTSCTPSSTRECGARDPHRPRTSRLDAPVRGLPRRPRPAGPLPDRRRPGQVGRRAVLRRRARQDPRHRRRVRLRQERHQPVDHGPAQEGHCPHQRRDLARRRGPDRVHAGGGPQAARQADGDDLPGPAVGDAPVLHGRQPDHRGVPDPQRRLARSGPRARDRHARPGRHPRAATSASTTTRTSSPAACGSAR